MDKLGHLHPTTPKTVLKLLVFFLKTLYLRLKIRRCAFLFLLLSEFVFLHFFFTR